MTHYTIKQLVWEDGKTTTEDYTVGFNGESWATIYWEGLENQCIKHSESEIAAKLAAQAHYEERLKQCLEVVE